MPSLFQSSTPVTPSLAAHYSVPFTLTRFAGTPASAPASMSLTSDTLEGVVRPSSSSSVSRARLVEAVGVEHAAAFGAAELLMGTLDQGSVGFEG